MSKKERAKQSNNSSKRKSIRLWPGIVAVVLQWLLRFGIVRVVPSAFGVGIFGGFLCGLAIMVWWAFFSRAHRSERWGGLILMIAAMAATWILKHGSMGPIWFVGLVVPVLSLAMVIWAVVCGNLTDKLRRVTLVATVLIASGVWLLFRTSGVTGNYQSNFAWRWTKTPEERLLDQAGDENLLQTPSPESVKSVVRWPGFRGQHRDGIIRGVEIDTDWSESPPKALWHRAVGPGWSSFAVSGDLFYTQEQRGDHEVVSCYRIETGEPVWMHQDEARFFESNGGAGPRGTPMYADGRIYTLGATGILNALNAADGSILWVRNAAVDTDTKVPAWGFSGSPLVVDDELIVSVAGSLIAYDLITGNPRWSNLAGGDCYSSPHLLHIDGINQILLKTESGINSFSPADGKLLWLHEWSGNPIVQPALIADKDILISVGERSGVRRISVQNGSDGWTVEARWTSTQLKPNFNDLVIHKNHAYGFDSRTLACIDVTTGERNWKGGRYGNGQLILLHDQDLLLVVSEKGELALVKAVPGRFTELSRFSAIKGKTWNHPVLANDILLVRNGQEMAAFHLSLSGS